MRHHPAARDVELVGEAMTTLAIIPARAGSKGLPGKNMRDLCGKPMVQWTIEAALASERVDDIVVTTDIDELDTWCWKWERRIDDGFCKLLSFKRAPELCTDDASMDNVIKNAIRWHCEDDDPPDRIILLQPTSPLRTAKHIDEALAILDEPKCMSVISCYEMQGAPLKMFCESPGGDIYPATEKAQGARRQDLPTCWMPNGAIYATRAMPFEGWFVKGRTFPYVMSPKESADVDDEHTFNVAETNMDKRLWGLT